MSNNHKIIESLKGLTTALNATLSEAESIENISFLKDSIKRAALSIYEQAQLLGNNELQSKQTVEEKIIKSEDIPVKEQPVITPPVIEPIQKVEIPEVKIAPVINIPVAKKEIPEAPPVVLVEEVKSNIPNLEEPVTKVVEQKVNANSTVTVVNKQEEIDVDEATVNGKIAKFKQPVINLADKLKDTPIKELVKAISISKKFEFINELFQGNAEAYKACIAAIESSGSFEKAANYIETNIADSYAWEENEDLAAEFFLLVKRRFL